MLAYEQAVDIFKITKKFPPEEKYSLTDVHQEVYAQTAQKRIERRYPAHFVLKITDSDAENSETNIWLDYSKDCDYLVLDLHLNFVARNDEIGRLLSHMINNPDKY